MVDLEVLEFAELTPLCSSGCNLVHAYVGAWLLCTNVKSAII
jgi:hypothetical protein